jgi:hypothetical protein
LAYIAHITAVGASLPQYDLLLMSRDKLQPMVDGRYIKHLRDDNNINILISVEIRSNYKNFLGIFND